LLGVGFDYSALTHSVLFMDCMVRTAEGDLHDHKDSSTNVEMFIFMLFIFSWFLA